MVQNQKSISKHVRILAKMDNWNIFLNKGANRPTMMPTWTVAVSVLLEWYGDESEVQTDSI